jgi:2-keto-4-pentenoate hydratase/2-oxohepta-3-ene-1,7-dioic acid hydratase in catechol pathway
MKLVSFTTTDALGTERLGVLTGTEIVEIEGTMSGLIGGGTAAIERAHCELHERRTVHDMTKTTLLAPITRPPRNIFCVGKNYHDHAAEFARSGFDATGAKDAIPEHAIFFTKSSNTVIPTLTPIPGYLDPTASVDYEGELTVVIGVGGRGISRQDAMAHVFGYTIINDVTSRTLQNRHRQWFLGKSIDGR